jgi:hypothetical protein
MLYMIVHRAGEIHKLRFKHEDEDMYICETNTGIFHPIHGWNHVKVMVWLEERGFEYYWESDHD